jgi:hypothetical protein
VSISQEYWDIVLKDYNDIPQKYRTAFLSVIKGIISNKGYNTISYPRGQPVSFEQSLSEFSRHLKNVIINKKIKKSEEILALFYHYRNVPGLVSMLQNKAFVDEKGRKLKASSEKYKIRVGSVANELMTAFYLEKEKGYDIRAFSLTYNESDKITIGEMDIFAVFNGHPYAIETKNMDHTLSHSEIVAQLNRYDKILRGIEKKERPYGDWVKFIPELSQSKKISLVFCQAVDTEEELREKVIYKLDRTVHFEKQPYVHRYYAGFAPLSEVVKKPVKKIKEALNFEGVQLIGRSVDYFRAVKKILEAYRGKIDFKDAVSADIMDSQYKDVWAKISVLEALSENMGVTKANIHLEGTLTWVDGIIQKAGKRTAVHTHRVYFHPAPSRLSEINEGNRRFDSYLKTTIDQFESGEAERVVGNTDEIVLAFDYRGYLEIRDHIIEKMNEVRQQYGDKYKIKLVDDHYIDEYSLVTEKPFLRDEAGNILINSKHHRMLDVNQIRRDINAMISRYREDELAKIIEGGLNLMC